MPYRRDGDICRGEYIGLKNGTEYSRIEISQVSPHRQTCVVYEDVYGTESLHRFISKVFASFGCRDITTNTRYIGGDLPDISFT